MFPIFAGNSASTGYNLTRSLRFRASASAYLNRTNTGTVTNNAVWTWSAWVKIGNWPSGNAAILFGNGAAGSANECSIKFTNNQLEVINYVSSVVQSRRVTTQVFRDPSAWYHIVVASNSSTSLNLYVNGVQITAFGTSTGPSAAAWALNTASTATNIGFITSAQNFDGEMTEINFIDGQALTPSSFGSTNALTGVWQPARYTGSYGTNGFYLPFTDNSALTTSSNAGLGKDFSGNGNYWTTNNISITAGVTYDSMTDVPTLTSATASNFCVVNPLSAQGLSAPINGNLTVQTTNADVGFYTGTISASIAYYFETTIGSGTALPLIGVVTPDRVNFYFYYTAYDGDVYANSILVGNVGVASTGDVIGFAVNGSGSNNFVLYKNGVSVLSTTLSALNVTPVIYDVSGGNGIIVNLNCGQRPFAYTAPSGYVALNTYNLPTSTIVKGNTVMDATLYTGNGSTQTITNAAAFKPDFVWTKSRSAATGHQLFDSVRGVTKYLQSNNTNAEGTDVNTLTAFNSSGFSVGSDAGINANAATFVGWQWQAGQGSTSSNTNGNVTSTVSVNASAGFSVVTYTVTSTASMTIGHGLGVAPQLIIEKRRDSAANWDVYTAATGNTGRLQLNSTAAFDVQAGVWNNTTPTSTVFSQQGNGTWHPIGATCVAYCWTPIAGYSAFGSYTGNGSADGPFTYVGFRPKFVIIKRTDTAGFDWCMYDTSRSPSNVVIIQLFANTAQSESGIGSDNFLDILSNGFKNRNTAADKNASGGTYIYMAFAENPFKNALAR